MTNIRHPAIPPRGINPREMKTHGHTKMCAWMFTAILFMIVKEVKITHMCINR